MFGTMFKVMETGEGLVQVGVIPHHLCWAHLDLRHTSLHPCKDVQTLSGYEILNVRVQRRPCVTEGNPRMYEVHVSHVSRLSQKRLRLTVRAFYGTKTECDNLASDVRKIMKWDETRVGQRLLVFINPASGRGRSQSLYRSRVEPIFQACGVQPHVIVTSRSGQIYDTIQTTDMRDFDGVVVAGGDGTYNECIEALLIHAMNSAWRDINNSEMDLVPTRIPVGIIPTGSGNLIAKQLHGTLDVATAAVHIVRGDTVASNVVTVHESKRLLGYSGLTVHFGFIGDLMRHCEMLRWLGPARYKVVPQHTLLHRRVANVEIEMYFDDKSAINENNNDSDEPGVTSSDDVKQESSPTEASDRARTVAGENDSNEVSSKLNSGVTDASVSGVTCQNDINESTADDDVVWDNIIQGNRSSDMPQSRTSLCVEQTKSPASILLSSDRQKTEPPFRWDNKANTEKVKGKIHNLGCHVTRAMTPDGAMGTCFGQDSLLCQVINRCSLPDFVNHLTKVRDEMPGVNEYKFVVCRDVKAVSVKLVDGATKAQPWFFNLDGQSVGLKENQFFLRLHPRVIRLYGRLEEEDDVSLCEGSSDSMLLRCMPLQRAS